MKPRRVQLSRRKGARKPPDAVNVARPHRLGNPYKVGSRLHGVWVVSSNSWGHNDRGPYLEDIQSLSWARLSVTPEIAVACYEDRMYLMLMPMPLEGAEDRAIREGLRDAVAALRGSDLACWCPLGQPCHADVLLRWANTSLLDDVFTGKVRPPWEVDE